jgi:hypothetical protein
MKACLSFCRRNLYKSLSADRLVVQQLLDRSLATANLDLQVGEYSGHSAAELPRPLHQLCRDTCRHTIRLVHWFAPPNCLQSADRCSLPELRMKTIKLHQYLSMTCYIPRQPTVHVELNTNFIQGLKIELQIYTFAVEQAIYISLSSPSSCSPPRQIFKQRFIRCESLHHIRPLLTFKHRPIYEFSRGNTCMAQLLAKAHN